jgi:hypothetical protein
MCCKAWQVIRAFCCAIDMYQGRKQSGGCALATSEYAGARARANDLVTGLQAFTKSGHQALAQTPHPTSKTLFSACYRMLLLLKTSILTSMNLPIRLRTHAASQAVRNVVAISDVLLAEVSLLAIS